MIRKETGKVAAVLWFELATSPPGVNMGKGKLTECKWMEVWLNNDMHLHAYVKPFASAKASVTCSTMFGIALPAISKNIFIYKGIITHVMHVIYCACANIFLEIGSDNSPDWKPTPRKTHFSAEGLVEMPCLTMFCVVEMTQNARIYNVICLVLLRFAMKSDGTRSLKWSSKNAFFAFRCDFVRRDRDMFTLAIRDNFFPVAFIQASPVWPTSHRHCHVWMYAHKLEFVSALFLLLMVTNWSGMACFKRCHTP